MKKLFIGCGVVLLVLIGVLAAFVWQLMPDIRAAQAAWEQTGERLQTLEQSFPFDAETDLDPGRFASHLELRAALVGSLRDLESEIEAGEDDEEAGFSEILSRTLRGIAPLATAVGNAFEQARMGPSEFSYHSHVLWTVLRELDSGTGGPEFDPLRDRYSALSEIYDRSFEANKELPPLDEMIGPEDGYPQGVLDAARIALASDMERAVEATSMLEIELPIFLNPELSNPDAMGTMVFTGSESNAREEDTR